MITKKIKVWLRDKIWYYCYYVNKGKEWDDSLDPKKPLGDMEGMRACQNRARDIMEGVNKNVSIYVSIYLCISIYLYIHMSMYLYI